MCGSSPVYVCMWNLTKSGSKESSVDARFVYVCISASAPNTLGFFN